jgi:hypothetical protein
MVIDEGSRHRLFKRLEDLLGQKEASTLMAHLPPVGWADVATKSDVESLRALTKSDIEAHRALTKSDLEAHRALTKSDLETLEARVDANLHRMESRLLRMILISNSTAVLTVGGLAFAAARLV